ncbi:MAG TPA: zinc-binding dehydrogenase [Gaiellaceae bacterium]|nr:zinc-binding dehydrogenase [Gaiellaceae bacterium]
MIAVAAEPRTMRAAVLHGWDDVRVEQVPVPEVGPGEALVRVLACGICGTDLKIVSGGFEGRWPPSLPFVLGHEWCGEIVRLGPGAEPSGLQPGDRVAAENHAGCGECARCRAGRYNLCERTGLSGYKLYGHTAQGALAEFAVRPVRLLHRLPDTVSNEAGALVNQGALTVHAVRRTGLDPGSSAAVFGPGLLGLMMMQVARAAGAATTIVVGRGGRLEIARELGATHVVDYEQGDPVEAIRALTGGRGVDRVYDCSGSTGVVAQALASVARGGRVALTGLAPGKLTELAPDRLVLDEIDVLGIRSSPNAYPGMIALLGSGAVRTGPLTRDVYPLEEMNAALEALRRRTDVRPILVP